jgi:hypothetical protein
LEEKRAQLEKNGGRKSGAEEGKQEEFSNNLFGGGKQAGAMNNWQ